MAGLRREGEHRSALSSDVALVIVQVIRRIDDLCVAEMTNRWCFLKNVALAAVGVTVAVRQPQAPETEGRR
jgi:hypothetical protein